MRKRSTCATSNDVEPDWKIDSSDVVGVELPKQPIGIDHGVIETGW